MICINWVIEHPKISCKYPYESDFLDRKIVKKPENSPLENSYSFLFHDSLVLGKHSVASQDPFGQAPTCLCHLNKDKRKRSHLGNEVVPRLIPGPLNTTAHLDKFLLNFSWPFHVIFFSLLFFDNFFFFLKRRRFLFLASFPFGSYTLDFSFWLVRRQSGMYSKLVMLDWTGRFL